MSYMLGAGWVGRLGGYTLVYGTGSASGVSTFRYGVGAFCSCGTEFGFGCSCRVADMLKIAAS